MSTTITHKCGHTTEREKDYSDAFAAMLAMRPCNDCFRVEYAAAVARYAAEAGALPALRNGTEKQVAWATKLRGEWLEKHPGYRRLARFATDVRVWIDGRDDALDHRKNLGIAAAKADAFGDLAATVAREAREAFWRTSARADDALQEAVHRALGMQYVAAARLYALIGAERDAIITEIMTPLDDSKSDAKATSAQRALLVEAIEEMGAHSDKILEREHRAEAERIESKRRAAEEAARAAAASEAHQRAIAEDRARRLAPFNAVFASAPRMEDDGDGYWTKRRGQMVRQHSLEQLESTPRAVEAVRVLCAVTTRDALKALERVHSDRRLALVLDAAELAGVVGPNAARALHVAAGLPKPVISRKKAAVA
jgi:hypothetical protein